MRKPVALLAEQIAHRHLAVAQLEHGRVRRRHAQLGRQIFADETLAAIDDEGADAAAALGIGEADHGIGDAAVGDKIFDTVEDEMIAAPLVGRLHFQRIAAGLRLGQAEGQHLLAAARGRQIAAFLLVVAPGHDRIFADGGVAGEEGAHAGAFAADAGQGAGIGHRVGAAAAVFRGHGHAEQVVLAGQRNDLIVVAMLDVAQLLDGPNFLAKRLDIRKQPLLIRRRHEGLLHVRGKPRSV